MNNNIIVPDFTQSGVKAGQLSPVISEPPKEMLSVTRTENQTKVRINSSSLSQILSCPRKAMYALHQKWKPRTISTALIFGHAIHKALEVFYSHPARERTLPVNFGENAAAMAYGHPAPNEHFLYHAVAMFISSASGLETLPDTDKRSLASGVWLLSNYFKTYLHDAYTIYSDAQGPVVERRFEVPVSRTDELEIVLFGTIDFALKNEATGEILIGDHKTTSMMGAEFLSRIKPNHQYTGYVIGAQRCLGIMGEHFLVNGIQTKAQPLTSRGSAPTFTRQITRRSAADIAEFIESLQWAVTSYLQWLEHNRWPIGHVDACAMYGACTYIDVCSAPMELRQNILEAKFTKGI
jgi:hypothetical protein